MSGNGPKNMVILVKIGGDLRGLRGFKKFFRKNVKNRKILLLNLKVV